MTFKMSEDYKTPYRCVAFFTKFCSDDFVFGAFWLDRHTLAFRLRPADFEYPTKREIFPVMYPEVYVGLAMTPTTNMLLAIRTS